MRVSHTLRPRLLLTLAALSLAAACDVSDGPESVAQVRFLHASQGRAAIDFRADGTTQGSTDSEIPGIAANGGLVAFTVNDTGAVTKLVATDANTQPDATATFRHNRIHRRHRRSRHPFQTQHRCVR